MLPILAALTACSGGGGSGDSSPTAPAPVVPVAPGSITLAGVVATGRALAGATVEARCSSGTGSGTSSSSGSYAITIASGSLPCMVRATSGATVLHSVATGTGSSASANVTPLTDLVLAQAAGGSAASLFASFDATAQAKVDSAALTSATAAVATALQSVVNVAGVNPFTDALVAANGTTPGNALDGRLDTLGAALTAAQLSVQALGAAIASNGAAAATVVATQVQPATATCPSLRSGAYRSFSGTESALDFNAYAFQKSTVNATALTITAEGGSAAPFAPVAGKPCHFTADGGRIQIVVSPSGVTMTRYVADNAGSTPRVQIGFPEQAIPLADLAGIWNTVELARDTPAASTYQNSYAQATLNAAGRVTQLLDCRYLSPCTAGTPPGDFAVNAAGGFNVPDTNGTVGRFFAYRAPSGDLMMVGVTVTGIIVAGKQRALTLPAVGEVDNYWDVLMGSAGTASDLTADIRTVTAVNAGSAGFTRSYASSGLVDTTTLNNPRPGLRSRTQNACTTAAGAAATCGGWIAMPLPGMGLTVYGSNVATTNAALGLQVTRPAGSTSTGVQSSTGTGTVPGTSGAVNITALTFVPGTVPRLEADFDTDMQPIYGTTGNYVPLPGREGYWPTPRKFVIEFQSVAPGGSITLRADGFASVQGGRMAADRVFTFPAN